MFFSPDTHFRESLEKIAETLRFTVLENPPFNLTCHETTMNMQIIIGLAILTRPIAQAILILAIMFPNFMSAQIINSQGGNLSVQVTNSNSTVGIINQYQSDCHQFTSNKHDKIEKLLNCTIVPNVVIIFLRVPRSLVSKSNFFISPCSINDKYIIVP